ncbi:MAG TPA: DNA replication and repair protein RecF [Solirubrobacteraceae bacterium]|jgi:DNA replication and repair protein RecF|nr:DNA replication and repair protein RecF [Solirubrobacteraceae bacterium]
MRVLGVELRDFRTYARAEAALGEGLTVVHGPNGAGKSNLLEALYFGCTAHALRARSDRELVRFGARATRVTVRLRDDSGEHELSVGYDAGVEGEPPAKRMRADGAPVERLLDLEIRPLISVFLPDRLGLLKGPPAGRRAHLDQFLLALWPARAGTRRSYAHALAQRNALLAAIRAARAGRETLSTWDHELARHALALREDRASALELVAPPFASLAARLGLLGEARIEYRPRSRATDLEGFLSELHERLPGELERGYGLHGPHRDELAILRDGRELRTYGSQGEIRLALLALLLAERSVLAEHRPHAPLMLLDDVMSELDAERRELLASELSTGGQSVIATTDPALVPGAVRADVTRLRVGPGTILQEALAA